MLLYLLQFESDRNHQKDLSDNRQVKNNVDKFDSDFMFELTDEETEYLRSNFLTANINSKSRYNPHVFTEQGL